MVIDQKMAGLLSDFFLDIAKAVFIATFIAPSMQKSANSLEILLLFSQGVLNTIIFLVISRFLLQVKLNK